MARSSGWCIEVASPGTPWYPRRVAVARVTEIVASSPDGFREAVEEGVARAAATLRHLTGLEVTGKRVKVQNGLIVEYRVEMKLIFVLE